MTVQHPYFKGGNLAGETAQMMHDMLKWQEQIEEGMSHVHGMWSFDDIVRSVLMGDRQFYDFGDCFVIMELSNFPKFSVYHCFLAGGSTDAILRAEPHITEIAKAMGCSYLSISGRVGWPRRLKNEGWKHVMSVMHKEIK